MKRRGFWSVLTLAIAAAALAFAGRASAGPVPGSLGLNGGGGNDTDPGKLVGTVVNAAGEAVEGATVLATSPTGGFKQAKSGANGGFEFPELKPGKWMVKAFKMGIGWGMTEATVESGKTTEVKIVLKGYTPPATGKLVVSVVNQAGEAVADAGVQAFSMMGGAFGKTDAKGTVSFDLKAGTYSVLASKLGVGQGKGEAKVEEGKTTEIKIVLIAPPPPATGSVKGVVVDGAGAPVAEAMVSIGGPAGGANTKTNEAGEFAFEKVKVGKNFVFAQKMGVGFGYAEIAVEEGKTTEVKITLKK
jgi:Carboxypeptidase regulatory-like domain